MIVQKIMSDSEIVKALIKCANFAAVKHRNQRRKDHNSTPYINHPIGVAYILTEEANVTDVNVIQAAMLHDTVEDTDCSFEEIEQSFGTEVKNIVVEVTDDMSLSKYDRKEMQVSKASGSSFEAKLVKLADKLYNLRDLEKETPRYWTEQRVQEYFVFAKNVVEGLRGTNEKLEVELDELFKKRNVL